MSDYVELSAHIGTPTRLHDVARVIFRKRGLLLAPTAVALAACASTPKVEVSYFFPKAQTQLTISQTFVCPIKAAPNDQPSVVAAVTQNTTYAADHNQEQWHVDFNAISGVFSDADTAINLTDDGRLSGVNASSTGEGDKIVQDVVSLASVVAGVASVAAAGTPRGPQAQAAGPCDVVRKHFAGDSMKTPPSATMTYTINLLYGVQPVPTQTGSIGATPTIEASAWTTQNGTANAGVFSPSTAKSSTTILIRADPDTNTSIPQGEQGWRKALTVLPDLGSQALESELNTALPADGPNQFAFSVQVGKINWGIDATKWADADTSKTGVPVIRLNRLAIVPLVVLGPSHDKAKPITPIWKGEVSVPIASYFDVPIPKGAIFGKTQFTLLLTSAGGISKLEYGTTTGATDAGDLALVLGKAIKGPSAEQKASVSQGKADKIYEDHRVAICTASASDCPSK